MQQRTSRPPLTPMTFDVSRARAAFPALSSGFIYAENAGGSQCLADAVARMSDYLLNTNVQLGADYPVSVSSTRRIAEGVEAARELFNAESVDEVVFGSSATMLVENLSRAMEADVNEGDEIVVTGEHEGECSVHAYERRERRARGVIFTADTMPPANGGPWKRLAGRRGATIKYWHATPSSSSPNNPYAVSHSISTLLPLITAKTRLVAFAACSNILGSIMPVREIVYAVRARAGEVGSRKVELCMDCVAYAPHRQMDVRGWDVDYCVFSLYKARPAHPAPWVL